MLTDEQRKVVEHIGSPLRVLAGPGTGKTFCIAHRIKHLIDHHKIAPYNIYGVTFTNKAAAEMRNRLEKIGMPYDKIPHVGTLHSLAKGLLHSNYSRVGLSSNFCIIGRMEQRVILKDVKEDLLSSEIKIPFKGNTNLDDYLYAYTAQKSGACLPSWLGKNSTQQRILSKFSQQYEDTLRFYYAIDWTDVIAKTIDLIKQYQDVREKLNKQILHLLVDEYQDLNPNEQILIDLLIANPSGLCVVGDDDQSIYESFRFADPSGIINFQKKLQKATSLFLTLCRRCPPEVIAKAMLLIKHNINHVEKILRPYDPDKKGVLVTFRHRSKKREVEWLTEKIKNIIRDGYKSEDILVLFQDGKLAEDYIASMKSAGIPVDVQLRVASIFDSQCFHWFLATLRFLTNQSDNLALRQCLDYWQDIGSKTIRQLRKIAESKHGLLWVAIQAVAKSPNAFKEIRHRKAVGELYAYLETLRKLSGFSEMLDHISKYLKGCQDDPGVKVLHGYVKSLAGKEGPISLKEALENFEQKLDAREFEGEDDSQVKGVKVMTMHGAKGLEAPVVFIPALEQDIIPGETSNLEERRRLFYVSLTRTKVNVFLSWASQRVGQEVHMPGRKVIGKQKTKFLDEIGE